MSTLLKKSLRDLGARRWQAVGLVVLVATLVTATAGSSRAGRTLENTRAVWNRELGRADLEIRCSPTAPGVLDPVRGWQGIAAAEERTLLPGVFRAHGTEKLLAIVRVLPDVPPEIDRLRLVAGRYPVSGEQGVVLDRSLLSIHGIDVGDEVQLEMTGQERRLTVVGISISPDHLLYPCHPIYRIPLAGTVAVVGLSSAAAATFDHADHITSLAFRFADGSDPEALEARLLDELSIVLMDVQPRGTAPQDRVIALIICVFEIYAPATLLILAAVAITLLVLTLQRTVRRQQTQIGLLLALGHRPSAIAATYLPTALVPVLAGALIGVLNHGWYGRFVSESYMRSVGFAPLQVAGPGSELLLASGCCVLIGTLAAFWPAYSAARRAPVRLMRPAPAPIRASSVVLRVSGFLRDRLRLPQSVAIGLGYLWRRRGDSLAAVVSLGCTFALVVGFVCVHISFEDETLAAVNRFGLDAAVRFTRPVGEDTLLEAARRAEGRVEPTVVQIALVEYADGPALQPLLCLPPDGWFRGLPIAYGRRFTEADAAEVVVDQSVADLHGVRVGDRLTCSPGYNAPEGVEVEVVGILDGASSGGRVFAPLEVGRNLFGLGGLATGMDVASELPSDQLLEVLRAMPQVEFATSMGRARSRVLDSYMGLTRILIVMVLIAVVTASLYLMLLSVLDTADRAPDMAILRTLGWRDRSALSICVTEVTTRGWLAYLLSIPLAPVLAQWLLDRLREANHYRVELVAPLWVFVAVGLACLVLIPLGALPAWLSARRGSPGEAVRKLRTE